MSHQVQLTFDTEFVDFGKVKRGEKREYTFHFTNSGTVPIEIDLISSCDCTTVEWAEGRVYKPGDEGQLHAIFDSTEKEESETVDIDVILKNSDPAGNPIFYILQYKFELVQ